MKFENYYIVLILFFLLLLFFSFRETRKAKDYAKPGKILIISTLILLLAGSVFRLVYLDIPAGINPDEAMSGYNSWCLAHYGVDMHLSSYPVYLKAWGSGMNALYAYIAIPFIKLFGLSLPVFRLPMALIGCLSLYVLYYTLRRTQQNNHLVFFVIFLMVISPWHIMKSRWALESNIAPDIILMGLCFLVLAYNSSTERKTNIYFFLGIIFIAISAYAYAVTWFMLPILYLLLFFFFYKKGKVKISRLLLAVVCLFILLFPLLLFAYLMASGGEQIELSKITITTLDVGRHEKTSILGNPNAVSLLTGYAKDGMYMLVIGDDRLRWNSFFLFGQFYNLLGIPFIMIAGYLLWKKKIKGIIFDRLLLFLLISSLPILIFVEPNVNRWNVLWFPLIYFMARGVCFFAEKKLWINIALVSVFFIVFLGFSRKYVTFYTSKGLELYVSSFKVGYQEYINFVKKKGFDKIYFSEVYPYSLFYDPIDPYEYNSTKIERKGNHPFDRVSNYTNYSLYIPEEVEPKPKTAYIIGNDRIGQYKIDKSKFQVKVNNTYTLLWND